MSDKQEWVIANPESGTTRTTTDPGSAKVMGGGAGKSSQPFNLSSLAYTAGGGALGYFLSKWLMDDDEEDENGKKKEGGLLKSLVPWLSAAAGALGGHVLSGAMSGNRGTSGEFAFRKNEDGSIDIPKKPRSGGTAHRVGNIALATSAVSGARSAANYVYNRPNILRDKATRIRALGTPESRTLARKLESLANNIDAKRAGRNGFLRGTGRAFGGNLSKGPGWAKALTGWKGSLATTLASLGLSGGAHWLGSEMNEDRREWQRAMESLGLREKK